MKAIFKLDKQADSAVCILTEKHQNKMDECPLWKCEKKDEYDSNCEFYTEHWLANK